MNLNQWREPFTKAFSCELNPTNKSCDNGVLFTMEAADLGLIPIDEAERIALLYEIQLGLLGRYPGVSDPCSWDDHLAAAAVSHLMAVRINLYMTQNDWTLPTGEYLGRFAVLEPTIRARAGLNLSLWNQLKAAAAFIWNCFEAKEHTSGKRLLRLSSRALWGEYPIVNAAIAIWRIVMNRKYPGGLAELQSIYFPAKNGIPHPFTEAVQGF